ncbi:uncharacterized protein [Onthophagus taurus]|uniref:uncharacterized protein n=1 Tax=Onthophagus taurus TaxID=166361 RepID=UPI0039BDD3FD
MSLKKIVVGSIKGYTAKLVVKEDAKMVFHKPYSMAYVLKEPVEVELKRMVKEGILLPTRQAEMASPIVTVKKKDGGIRICADFKKTLNPALRTDPLHIARCPRTNPVGVRKGSEIAHADSLSRLPLPEETPEEIKSFTSTNELPISADEIASETRKDRVLCKVMELTKYGWPDHMKDLDLKPYFKRRNELSIEGHCLTWGNRVMEILHDQHPGIVRMKLRARSDIWWPGLGEEIEQKVNECEICQTSAPKGREQALKKQLINDINSTIKLQHKLDNFLFNYRNTPTATNGMSPAEMMFKQIPRNKLNMIKPRFTEGKEEKKRYLRIKEYEDKRRRVLRYYTEGESVWINTTEKNKWLPRKILKVLSNVTYLVYVEGKVRFVHAHNLKEAKQELIDDQEMKQHLPYIPTFSEHGRSDEPTVATKEDPQPESTPTPSPKPSLSPTPELVLRRSNRIKKPISRLNF